jgi:N-acetyl sugar amidotransferase
MSTGIIDLSSFISMLNGVGSAQLIWAMIVLFSVSGGKDSTRLAIIARDLGLNPLLVSTVNPPEMQNEIGISNLDNLMNLGFDIITVEPDPIVFKKLMRKAFVEYGNYGKSTELALYASAPRLALAYGIKMIFLGENNSLVYGEDIEFEDGGDASNMVDYNTLGGGQIDWMIDKEDEILYESLFPYQYPNRETLKDNGIKIVYLGFYFKDFNNITNGGIAVENGLSVRNVPQEFTGCVHNFDALDEDFVHVNQMLKYYKFGFGKATDEACELIRMGIKTRKEGFEITQRLDGKCHHMYIDLFCKYLEISDEEFWNIVNKFINRDLWIKVSNKWQLKHNI